MGPHSSVRDMDVAYLLLPGEIEPDGLVGEGGGVEVLLTRGRTKQILRARIAWNDQKYGNDIFQPPRSLSACPAAGQSAGLPV